MPLDLGEDRLRRVGRTDVVAEHRIVGQHRGLQAGRAGGLGDAGGLQWCRTPSTTTSTMSSPPWILVGAPTMPTIGPRGSVLRNLSSTSLGLSFLPTINRAEARFSTGCTRSPIRTNAAPLDLLSRICASPKFGDGLKKASTPQAPVMRIAITTPTISARIWPRIGSWIIRESPRISACSSRRIKNR